VAACGGEAKREPPGGSPEGGSSSGTVAAGGGSGLPVVPAMPTVILPRAAGGGAAGVAAPTALANEWIIPAPAAFADPGRQASGVPREPPTLVETPAATAHLAAFARPPGPTDRPVPTLADLTEGEAGKVSSSRDWAKDVPVAEATKDSPVAEATKDRPVAEATKDRPVAEATKDSPVAEAAKDGPVAEATRVGPVAKAAKDRLLAEAAEDGPLAEATKDGPLAEATKDGLLAPPASACGEPVPGEPFLRGAPFSAPAPFPAAPPLLAPSPWSTLPPRPQRTQGYFGLALRVAGGLTLTLAVGALLLVMLYRVLDPPTSMLMLGQQLSGTPVYQRWVSLERISAYLSQAVILSEDAHFCRHGGVDWGELAAAIENAHDGVARGGSTITMQVVKNLFLWPSRSYVRKALEFPLAYGVELAWSKRRILEVYLNIAEWGPGIFGAEAAALYHFRKSAAQLTPREAALLAVSLPNPLQRRPGRPGPGLLRLANHLAMRMHPGVAVGCLRSRQ
jgi:monofunctional glycosyltransferase